jgi:hypothetical protein
MQRLQGPHGPYRFGHARCKGLGVQRVWSHARSGREFGPKPNPFHGRSVRQALEALVGLCICFHRQTHLTSRGAVVLDVGVDRGLCFQGSGYS